MIPTPHVLGGPGGAQLLKFTLMLIDLLDHHRPNLDRLLAVDLTLGSAAVLDSDVQSLAAAALRDATGVPVPEVRQASREVATWLARMQASRPASLNA